MTDRSERARRNGAKSKGPTSTTGKRWSSKNSFKTGLYAKTIEAFPKDLQDHYNRIHKAYRTDYRPSDSIEDDLLAQMAFNRTRYFYYLSLLGENLENGVTLEKLLGQLERSYIRTLNSLESRRRQHPQLGKPDKLIIQWIDPRTGKPWRTEPDELTPKTEGTNPPTPTKQEPESRQVRRRRERLERKKSRASDDIRDGLYG
ncbi:MAG TPA: hypothetical protein PLF84_11080 [Bryobacteraceae bacterium]|nr:hypothetical protein [Bryobacteraceae bacterium]